MGVKFLYKKNHRYDKHSCAIYEILSSKTNIKLPNTSLGQNKGDELKDCLLVKNPQFLFYPHGTW